MTEQEKKAVDILYSFVFRSKTIIIKKYHQKIQKA